MPTISSVAAVLAVPRQPSSRNAMPTVTASAAMDTTAATSSSSPERHRRYQREDERGEGGVRELDTRLLLPGIQARRIVPGQHAAHPVHAQVEPFQHADRRVCHQRGHIQPRSCSSYCDTDGEQHVVLPPPRGKVAG